MQLMKAHHESPIPDLCALRPDVPADVQAIFARMMAKRPEDRFQSAVEVATALELFTRKEAAPPDSLELPVFDDLVPTTSDENPNSRRTRNRATGRTELPSSRVDVTVDDSSVTDVVGLTSASRQPRSQSSRRKQPAKQARWIVASVAGLVLLVIGIVVAVSRNGSVTDSRATDNLSVEVASNREPQPALPPSQPTATQNDSSKVMEKATPDSPAKSDPLVATAEPMPTPSNDSPKTLDTAADSSSIEGSREVLDRGVERKASTGPRSGSDIK